MVVGQLQVETTEYQFKTDGEIEIIDLTDNLNDFVKTSGIQEGRVNVFVPGSTGAIVAVEYERGLLQDVKEIIPLLIPKGKGYQHDRIDSNAHSHLRATLYGPEMTIPVTKGTTILGTWQQVVFLELDVRPRHRRVVFQIMGVAR
ncbi:MAG: secondary thiamine-phosphate synthase enzyme YjbQ [Candidatus Kariarchaeaceae archaeon]|jgi:secondary thiamine-phosphate synthase enzyme